MTKGAAIILTAAVGCTISPFLRGVAMGSDGYGGWGMGDGDGDEMKPGAAFAGALGAGCPGSSKCDRWHPHAR